jgi:hypothetical protein
MPRNTPSGLPTGGEFALTAGDPNPCTVGFLPPSSWRSPADTSDIDTPDGLYCKLPQDSPSTVRGARNYPCMGHPGKRAPTVQLCDDPRGFEPMAVRPHVLGPYPFDPNLIAQGVPPDSRVTGGDNIYAPVEGTPPPGGAPAGNAPAPPPTPPMPIDQPDPPNSPSGAAPSDFRSDSKRPGFAVAQYNPRTGNYVAQDGHIYSQSNLAAASWPTATWTDLMPH